MRSDLDASAFFPARPEPIRNKAWPVLPYFQGRPWHWCGLSRNSPGNCRVHVEILLQRFRRLSSNKLLFRFHWRYCFRPLCNTVFPSRTCRSPRPFLSARPDTLGTGGWLQGNFAIFRGRQTLPWLFPDAHVPHPLRGLFKPLHCLVVPLVCQ